MQKCCFTYLIGRFEWLHIHRNRRIRVKIKIFVMTHKKFNPPKEAIYIPLHVGKYGKQDLGYMGDDIMEN